MAQKDYVSSGHGRTLRKNTHRKKRSAPVMPKTFMALTVALVIFFIGGLWLITNNKPRDTPALIPTNDLSDVNKLPPKPEERWRYIKELENRQPGVQVPTAPFPLSDVNPETQLTDEQRQLLEQIQMDMRQQPTELPEVPGNNPLKLPNSPVIIKPPTTGTQQSPGSPGQITVPMIAAPEISTTPSPSVSRTVQPDSGKGKTQHWLLQCGAFRSMVQAETIRAQLAFSGLESHITVNKGWNRVVLGPYSRPVADKILHQLTNTDISGCIPLKIRG